MGTAVNDSDAVVLRCALERAPVAALLRENGCPVWANDALLKLLGTDADTLFGAGAPPDARFEPLLGDAELVSLARPDGVVRWLRRLPTDAVNDAVCCEYLLDVTREIELARQLDELEVRDRETGVLNRRSILAALDKQIARSRRYGNPLAVGLLSFQPAVPLEPAWSVLIPLIQELRAQLRWVDEVGRLDGTRVLLVLPETPEANAAELLTTICRDRFGAVPDADLWQPSVATTAWSKGDDARRVLERLDAALSRAA